MSKFDSDSGPEDPWDDRGELAWNEFDWERYLREQEESIQRYQRLYEAALRREDRIDFVAGQMDWESADEPEEASAADGVEEEDDGVYTLHKNPLYISTRAIFRSVIVPWERLGADPATVPQPLAVRLLSALRHGETQAVEAIHALDFGDYAMAVTLFKRALSTLNESLAALQESALSRTLSGAAWRDTALPRLFDLREIWLRAIAACRDEIERLVDEDEE
jgi:hypothetical protein